MPNLNIGNEVVDTCQVKRVIKRNIAGFQQKIACLNMNSRVGVHMLRFYAQRIKEHEVLLQWVLDAEQRNANSQTA